MNLITENHWLEEGYIGLINIKLENMPDTLTVAGYDLGKKAEFHMTILCPRKVANLIDSSQAEKLEGKLVEDFLAYNAEHPMVDFTLSDTFYLMRKDNKATLVVMGDMPAAVPFFDMLRAKYGYDIPQQPVHITLYTQGGGIGILSQEELGQFGQLATVPELADLKVVR